MKALARGVTLAGEATLRVMLASKDTLPFAFVVVVNMHWHRNVFPPVSMA